MKKFLIILIILSLTASLCACGGAYETGGSGLNIIATVFPAFDFARAIAGEDANVCLLVPPGSETHSFEPTAQDILRIQNCDLFICNGGESEHWVEELLGGVGGEINVLCMLDCVDALEEETKEGMQVAERAHDEHEREYDEHVWTSPVNAVRICAAITERLCLCDGANSARYESNFSAYRERLLALDAEFRGTVASARCRSVIFADRFPVRYFTEEYGLDYYAAFPGCADDAEPSAKTVAFLIDRVRELNSPAVFHIEFSNEKMADIVCEDAGCRKLLFHSCHTVSRDELLSGVTYLELMEANAAALKEALS